MSENIVPDELRPLLGKTAVHECKLKNQEFTNLVRIVDGRKLWDRLDLLIETNTGCRVWASTKTVRVVTFAEPEPE